MDVRVPPTAQGCREFHAREGRVELCLRLMPQGRDLHAFLLGGEAHVGAVALASPGEAAKVLQRQSHREGELAGRVAERLAGALGCAVSVSSGIHFADISRAEITTVEKLAERLVDDCLQSLSTRSDEPC